MLDKRKYKLRKLADRGWEDLRRQLDHELPVATGEQRPTRIAIWWPAAAALLVGLAVGSMLDPYFSGSDWARPAATLSRESAPDRQATQPVPGLPSAGGQETLPAAICSEPAPAAAVPEQPSSGWYSAEKAVLSSKHRESALQASQGDDTSSIPTEETAASSPQSEVELPALSNAATAIPALRPSRSLNALSPTAQLPIQPLASAGLPTLAVSQQLPLVSPSQWELYLGGLMPDYFGAGGVSLGVMKSRPIKGGSFNHEFGLGYTYLIQPMTVTFTQEEQDVMIAGTQVSGSEEFTTLTTTLGNQQSTYGGISSARLLKSLRLHYLELPFSLSMRANARLRLRVGLLASLMLNSRSDYTSGGLFAANPRAKQLEENAMDASINYVGMTKARELKVFDLSTLAGLDVQLNPNWSLGLSSQYGLLDMIPDNGRGDFNRLLRFSLRYAL
jgi:hypothetical protein